jgi:hypothetical protein
LSAEGVADCEDELSDFEIVRITRLDWCEVVRIDFQECNVTEWVSSNYLGGVFGSVAEAYFDFAHVADDVVACDYVSVFAPDGACSPSPSSGSYPDNGSRDSLCNVDYCVGD